jgi:hypothetical protein
LLRTGAFMDGTCFEILPIKGRSGKLHIYAWWVGPSRLY